MECTNSNKGSYAWRSLLQARYVINLGAVWRVGDGRSTFIRTDKWLPKNPAVMIVSPPTVLPLDSRVSELIDEATHTWKSDLVHSEFLAHEANMVLGIPLSCSSTLDRQVWFPTKNGSYSTRSAYHLIAGVERGLKPNCSNSEMKHKLWSSIWNLQVPQ